MQKTLKHWLRFGLVLAVAVATFGLLARAAFLYAMPPGMEPERISHYNPNKIPDGVRKDLPPITDENGLRDIFFYPDGLLKGRVVHMRVPQDYVSTGRELPARHSDHIGFAVIYPSMKSVADPAVFEAMKKYHGLTLDEEIGIEIDRPDPGPLAMQVSGLFGRIYTAKKTYPGMKYEDLPAPRGFIARDREGNYTQSIRQIDTGLLDQYYGMAFEDFYIQWDWRNVPVRFMTCHMFQPRPSCIVTVLLNRQNALYELALSFHAKLLSQLPEMIERTTALVDSFVVKTY